LFRTWPGAGPVRGTPGFALWAIAGSVVKLVAYRRGL